MSLPRSCASTSFRGLSRRICKSGIRFALSILMGFSRHGWRPLNVGPAGVGKMRAAPASCRANIIQWPPHPAIPRQVAPQQSLPPLHRTDLVSDLSADPCLSRPRSGSQRSQKDSTDKRVSSKHASFFSMVQAMTSILAANFTRAFVLMPRSPWRPSSMRW